MPTLTKACKCWTCQEPMNVGDEFRWVKGYRWTSGGARLGNGSVGKVEAMKPAHPHDCFAYKLAKDRAKAIDEQCALVASHGATAEQVAAFRAHLQQQQ